MKILPIFVILIVTFIPHCYSSAEERLLLYHLLDLVNVLERPVANESDTLIVSMNLKLISISYVNWPSQQVGANFYIKYEWRDTNLKWNYSEYDGISKLYISPNRMWKPSIYLTKDASGSSYYSDSNYCDSNIVTSNGSITQEHSAKLETICEISLLDFPFEEHNCEFEFGSSVYTPEQLLITTYDGLEEGDLSELTSPPDFSVLGFPIKVTNDDNKSRVSYTIRIRRNGETQLKIIHIYCTTISTLIIFSCLISPASPHKLTISVIGIALCLFAVFDLVSRACAYAQNNTPIRIVDFFTKLLVINTVVFISNALVIYVYNLRIKMPQFLQEKVGLAHESYICFKSIRSSSKLKAKENKQRNAIEETEMNSLATKSHEENVNVPRHLEQCDWSLLSLMLDRSLFVVWAFTVILFTAVCFPKFNVSTS